MHISVVHKCVHSTHTQCNNQFQATAIVLRMWKTFLFSFEILFLLLCNELFQFATLLQLSELLS